MALKYVFETNIENYLTILLQQIETNSAFKSYFTCEGLHKQGNFIVKVWTDEFNSINPLIIKPQTINLSNYIQLISDL
jgi:hypothetical protein